MKIERTKNTKRNAIWGIVEKFTMMALPFITRTILLKVLGAQYLGLSSLFTSILQVLNMADLGIGLAITYSMYKPIAEDDDNTICALLALYKKFYHFIGTIILIAGICLLPFLNKFIAKEIPNEINIKYIFLIYLFNTVLSYYMFAYKKSILEAFQRNDIATKINFILSIIKNLMQIAMLFIFKNYYLFLIILPLITLANNISISIIVDSKYPKYTARGMISTSIIKPLYYQMSGVAISKICGVMRSTLSGILVSSFLGLELLAIYGNYFYILTSIHSMLTVLNTSMLAGIGNSLVKETKEKNYKDFQHFTFLYAWISSWCTCCLFCLYQHFMKIWVGQKLLFPFNIMILFCIYFYSITITDIKNMYVTASGLWWENRYRSITELLLNIILCYTLGRKFGVVGILVTTILTLIFINFAWGAKLLFNNYFKNICIFKLYCNHLLYIIVNFSVAILTFKICELLNNDGIAFLFVKIFICILIPNLLYFIIYYKTKIFKESMPIILRIIPI